MDARLGVYLDTQLVQDHILNKASINIGRQADNDIVINDVNVSRYHA